MRRKSSSTARGRLRVVEGHKDTNKLVVGIDDAGRGVIAGPLILAALWHPDPKYLQYIGATDSKRTTPAERELFKRKLAGDARAKVGYAAATPEWVNAYGVDVAEAQAVRRAFDQLLLALETDYDNIRLLVDGAKHFPNLPPELEVRYLPKGDGYEPLIAGASMLASALFDEMIAELHTQAPDWRLLEHRGAATSEHRALVYERGPQPWHRRRSATKAVAHYALTKRLPFPGWMTGEEDAS